MDLVEILIKTIGNKYFVLLLGIGMCFAIPPTWMSVKIIPTPMNIGVLLMAILSAGLAFYKFANMFWTQRKQPPQESKEW